MTIVFKVSDNIKKKMVEFYKPLFKEKTPPYAVFQAQNADVVITLYESGKVMFQGISADIESSIWIDQERHLNNRIINLDKDKKEKKDKKETKKTFYNISTIGSDEVGTGDYFGPIVVCATYVSKDNIPFLTDLGVRDSKKLTDEKIKEIAPTIIKEIPYSLYILDNKTYNANHDNINMNKMKAILHNKVLTSLLKKDKFNYEKIVIDEFEYPKKFYDHIRDAKERISNVTFLTKAEDQVMSVGCASIISRYAFLKEIKKLEEDLHTTIPLGAGIEVDKKGLEIVKKYGLEKLDEIAKVSFKNTEKIKEMFKVENN